MGALAASGRARNPGTMPPPPRMRGTAGYSIELREAAVRQVLVLGYSLDRVAFLLDVADTRTIQRWVDRYVATGSLWTPFEAGVGRTGCFPVMTRYAGSAPHRRPGPPSCPQLGPRRRHLGDPARLHRVHGRAARVRPAGDGGRHLGPQHAALGAPRRVHPQGGVGGEWPRRPTGISRDKAGISEEKARIRQGTGGPGPVPARGAARAGAGLLGVLRHAQLRAVAARVHRRGVLRPAHGEPPPRLGPAVREGRPAGRPGRRGRGQRAPGRAPPRLLA